MISPNYGNPAESHVPGKVGYVTCMKFVKTLTFTPKKKKNCEDKKDYCIVQKTKRLS